MESSLSAWSNFWRSTYLIHFMRAWGMSDAQWHHMIAVSNEQYEQNIVRYLRARQHEHPMYANGLAYYEMSDEEAEAAVASLSISDKMRARMEQVALHQYKLHLEHLAMV